MKDDTITVFVLIQKGFQVSYERSGKLKNQEEIKIPGKRSRRFSSVIILVLVALAAYQSIQVYQAKERAENYKKTLVAVVGVIADMQETADKRLEGWPDSAPVRPSNQINVGTSSDGMISIGHSAFGVQDQYFIHFGGVVRKIHTFGITNQDEDVDWASKEPYFSAIAAHDPTTYEEWYQEKPRISHEK